jgi:AraC-like DNA-binding protein
MNYFFDPVLKGKTTSISSLLPEHDAYAIMEAEPTTLFMDNATILLQGVEFDICKLLYIVLQVNETTTITAATDRSIFTLNFVLENNLHAVYAPEQSIAFKKGQFQLLGIPAGNYPIVYPSGTYRFLQMEILPDFIDQFLPSALTLYESGKVRSGTFPRRFGSLSLNISAKAWFLLNKILTNDQAGVSGRIAIETSAKELLLVSLNDLKNASKGQPIVGKEAERFEDIKAYLITTLDKKVSVEEICAKFGISKTWLYTGFYQLNKQSIHEYIITQKIEWAKLLLADGLSINEIAACIGYDNPSGFTRAFKQRTGLSPREFRKFN